jgi:hypothetical protein
VSGGGNAWGEDEEGSTAAGLSNDAAHPSITSLNRHLKVNANEEVEGLNWGPDAADVADTMNNSCTAAIYLGDPEE